MWSAGCAGSQPHIYQHQPTASDTPFGGGFPPDQTPNGDPFGQQERRGEIRVGWNNGPTPQQLQQRSADLEAQQKTSSQ